MDREHEFIEQKMKGQKEDGWYLKEKKKKKKKIMSEKRKRLLLCFFLHCAIFVTGFENIKSKY